MRLIDECDFCNNRQATDDPRIRAACEVYAKRTGLWTPAGNSWVCAVCRVLSRYDFHGGFLTLNDLLGERFRLSMGREVAAEFGLKIVLERMVSWPDVSNYCKLSDIVSRCDKCAFPMVLCMPDRENCKVVEDSGMIFDAVEKYISTHQEARETIKGLHADGKHVRLCKWLPNVFEDKRCPGKDRWHMKRPRAGLCLQRTAQMAKVIGLRACLVVVSPEDAGKPASWKRRNLLAKARKLLPALKYHGIVGWKGWAGLAAQP